MNDESNAVFCRQCGVNDDQQAKCDECGEMFPHEQLVHYDGHGVFCQECDERVEEISEDSEEETL